ncbi:unnamed protein product [Scytosiphon promiscuus]
MLRLMLHPAFLVVSCFLLPGSWSSHGFKLINQLHHPQHDQRLMLEHSLYSGIHDVKTGRTLFGLSYSRAGAAVRASPLLPVHCYISAVSLHSKVRLDCAPRMSCLGAAPTTAGKVGGILVASALRGGAGVEHNVISGVLAELGNIRTPAALLGGAALGTMFVPLKRDGNKRLHLLYTVLSTSAFSLQLVCVLCSTLSSTAIASRPEAMAVSAISYLSEQMQWEFYVIRASFVYGLFSFLGALSVRGWLTFSADGDRGCARVMTAILASSGIFLLNYLHYTHNTLTLCLGGMTKAVVALTMRNMYPTKKRFFRHVLWAAAVWGAVKVLRLGPNEGSLAAKQKASTVSSTGPSSPGTNKE